jgi:DNA phosphorothioation-associated putative methyltransferase
MAEASRGLEFRPETPPKTWAPEVRRHRTAIQRHELSRPVRAALEDQIINKQTTVLDYGCGRGDDVRNLNNLGVNCTGWDPDFCPETLRVPSDVVNLGYVVNVIEDPGERVKALGLAWGFARQVLIVSARVDGDPESSPETQYGDGLLTRVGTFQKFFEQNELKEWIGATLGTPAVAAAPGVFYVFRSDEQRCSFVSSRYRRRLASPAPRVGDLLFEKYRPEFESLMSFFAARGRLPMPGELDGGERLLNELGSYRRAFAVVRRVTGSEQWNAISDERRRDLLVFLALAMFPKCPNFGGLPTVLQYDVRAFFSGYNSACSEARALLFSLGRAEIIDSACQQAGVGKLLPDALYVHNSALHLLPPELRVYEGCARVLAGRLEGATLVKLSRREPKVTYLHYPKFDTDPHPTLAASLRVHLQKLSLKYREFNNGNNPPILHRKEALVPPDYPYREKFAKLTEQEERQGLLDFPESIGRKGRWDALIAGRGLRLHGHRLVRSRGIGRGFSSQGSL